MKGYTDKLFLLVKLPAQTKSLQIPSVGSSQFYERIIAEGLLAHPVLCAIDRQNKFFRYLVQSITPAVVVRHVAGAVGDMSYSTHATPTAQTTMLRGP